MESADHASPVPLDYASLAPPPDTSRNFLRQITPLAWCSMLSFALFMIAWMMFNATRNGSYIPHIERRTWGIYSNDGNLSLAGVQRTPLPIVQKRGTTTRTYWITITSPIDLVRVPYPAIMFALAVTPIFWFVQQYRDILAAMPADAPDLAPGESILAVLERHPDVFDDDHAAYFLTLEELPALESVRLNLRSLSVSHATTSQAP